MCNFFMYEKEFGLFLAFFFCFCFVAWLCALFTHSPQECGRLYSYCDCPDARFPSSVPCSQNPLHITLPFSLPNAADCLHPTFTRRTSGLIMGKFGALKFMFLPPTTSVVFSLCNSIFVLSFLCSFFFSVLKLSVNLSIFIAAKFKI